MKILSNDMYLLLIDEEAEIKENTWYENKGLLFLSDCKYDEGNNPNDSNPIVTDFNNSIIAYYPLNSEAKELEGLPLLPSLSNPIKSYRVGRKQKRAILDENGIEVVIFKTGNENEAQRYCDYLNGKYFSLEDIQNAISFGRGLEINSLKESTKDVETAKFIQSLSTQQLPKKFIPEIEIFRDFDWVKEEINHIDRLKTITNSESKEELVGTYVY